MILDFKFEEYNPRRAVRGADAVRVLVTYEDGESDLLWMSQADLKNNIKEFGDHPELTKALSHYK